MRGPSSKPKKNGKANGTPQSPRAGVLRNARRTRAMQDDGGKIPGKPERIGPPPGIGGGPVA
jgi:hypothetical protein